MNEKISFKFFYGNEADLFSFYRIPKNFFKCKCLKMISSDAKILYGLMLDRMSISIKNQWFDDYNRAYIYFSIEDIMEFLNCGRNKAVKVLQELEEIGLIEKRRQGLGKVSIIYVKTFIIEECNGNNLINQEVEKNGESVNKENIVSTEVSEINFRGTQNQTSGGDETKLQKVSEENSNYNNINNYKESKKESNLIISEEEDYDYEAMRDIEIYQEVVKNNIDYDGLILAHKSDEGLIRGIYDLILETILSTNDNILIAKEWYPTELVRSKFLKLNYSHIEYVLECLRKVTTKIKNIKKYLLAVLFNAPTTIDGYYRAEVNHDMPQFVV